MEAIDLQIYKNECYKKTKNLNPGYEFFIHENLHLFSQGDFLR